MDTPNKKLKVGLVLDGGLEKPDGVQQYIMAIGDWLRSQGHQAHYLVAGSKNLDVSDVHVLSRNIHVSSNGNDLSIPLPASRPRLKKFLRNEQFDVLHVQTPYSPLMGGKLVNLAGSNTAVVGTFHILPNSWVTSFGNRLLGIWCRRSLKRFDDMLSVSPAATVFAKETFKVDSTVLPNVINYERFHKAKPFSRYDDSKLTILFFGRLVPRKGCLVLLQAIAQLKQSGESLPDFRVIICGKGPLEKNLKAFVKQNNLGGIVEFTGFVTEEDKPRYYASADISVFPSSGGESFGIVLLEAMASGKAAVLAGDNPGYHSVMAPQEDLLFEPKNIDALALKIKKYMTNDSQRKQLANWGETYTASFDVNVVGKKLLEVYQEALRKRRNL
ncbi:MAG TPA: glycosyltransferase family 4 protein [Methylomirabilota bacterium]|nr:glycosyltransferase family 4 protein [Methylomirabilota bacterium]